MIDDLYQTLMSSASEPRLNDIMVSARSFLKAASIIREHGPSGKGQPAKEVSDLHAFRRRLGYYKNGAAIGLDETIESLAIVSGNVDLGVIETDQGSVALWLDEHHLIVGIMIMRMVASP